MKIEIINAGLNRNDRREAARWRSHRQWAYKDIRIDLHTPGPSLFKHPVLHATLTVSDKKGKRPIIH